MDLAGKFHNARHLRAQLVTEARAERDVTAFLVRELPRVGHVALL